MKLLVDSGSTKATWCVFDAPVPVFSFTTTGINPVRDSEDDMKSVIRSAATTIASELLMGRASSLASDGSINELWFYGAGCLPAYTPPLCRLLAGTFPMAKVSVESDLLGAARALCQHEEGIACILGTGSNSCLYDGRDIVANVSPLGWILGDEGSGAVMGRMLVGDVLKGQLPKQLCEEFMQRFNLTASGIIEAVYRQPLPNRFLASLVPFLAEHRGEECVHRLLVGAFRSFFVRNVVSYGRADLPVGFVGGVAYQFENELREAADEEHFLIGRVLRDPVPEMLRFHLM